MKQHNDNEALVILMEECAEVIQAASKIIRFGRGIHSLNNLNKEIGDLLCMVLILKQQGLIDQDILPNQIISKLEKLRTYSSLDIDNIEGKI